MQTRQKNSGSARLTILTSILMVLVLGSAAFIALHAPEWTNSSLSEKIKLWTSAKKDNPPGENGFYFDWDPFSGFPRDDMVTNEPASANVPALKGTNGGSLLPMPGKTSNTTARSGVHPATTNATARKADQSKPSVKTPQAKKAAGAPPRTTKNRNVRMPPDVAAMMDKIEQMAWSPATERILLDTINTWAATDMPEALEFALNLDRRVTRFAAVGNILNTWSKKFPEDALNWAVTMSEVDSDFERYIRPMFSQLAGTNIRDAMNNIWSMPSDSMKKSALEIVASKLIIIGKEQDLFDLYSSMPSGTDRDILTNIIIQQLGRHQPEGLLQWISSFEDTTLRNSAIDTLVSAWASDQPAAAAKLAASLPEDSFRAKQIAKITDNWVREDPVETANWLLSLFPPSPQTDAAVGVFVKAVMKNNPDAALSWARAVTEPKQRWKLIDEVSTQWMKKDPNGLMDYILNTDLPQDTQDHLLQMFNDLE